MMLLLNLLTLSSFTNKAVEVGVINDNTSIENDLVSLGLTPSDYIILEDTIDNNSYDEVYLIAVGENRQVEEYTDIYLYFYNPLLNDIYQDYYFEMKINNYTYSFGYLETEREWSYYEDLFDEPDFLLDLCEYDSNHNITKVKFAYSYNENKRIYNLDRIERLTDERSFTNPFTATFKEREEDGKLVTDYEYNSFIYITKDVVLTIDVTNYSVSGFQGWLNGVFSSLFNNDKKARLFIYNFSSSKRIDQIIEVDCLYSYKKIRDARANGGQRIDILEETKYTKSNPKTLLNEELPQNIYGQEVVLNRFVTPASDRINEFGSSFIWNEELKANFTNYEHSVLVDIGSYEQTMISPVKVYEYNAIENFEITRMKFETDGKIYNSYVADDPDDFPNEPNNPQEEKSWFDELLDWIKENPLYAVLSLLAVIVGLPLIISFLPMILKGIIQLIIGIIKLLLWIIFIPFRIIKKIINKAKEKKKIKQKEAIK